MYVFQSKSAILAEFPLNLLRIYIWSISMPTQPFRKT